MLKVDNTKILLVEDQQIARIGLKLILDEIPGFQVIGQAETGRQAIERVKDLSPEVIIMDIGLPDVDGIEATREIKKLLPQVKVIILTSHDDDKDIFAALRAGADGYCLKDIQASQLANGILSVKNAASWLDPRIAERVLNASERRRDTDGADLQQMVEADLNLLYLVERGLGNEEIAHELNLTESEVREKMRSIIESIFTSDKSEEAINLFRRQLAAHISDDLSCPQQELPDESKIFSSLVLGEIFADKYLLETLIDRGGMGRIYKAKHIHMERTVAIKILLPSLAQNRRLLRKFKDEVLAASALNHPNLVTVYDTGTWHGLPFLVMDYIEGDGLDVILRKIKRLSLGRFINLFSQVLDAIETAHGKNLIHCDVKPSNLLITEQSGKELVKIVDFGLARTIFPPDTDRALQPTASYDLSGSPFYMSPEQCMGQELDRRTDLYSIGCVMYESLTGVPPFSGSTAVELFSKHISGEAKPFAEVYPGNTIPAELEQIVFKLLAKAREGRIQSALELKRALKTTLPQLSCTDQRASL